MDTTRCIGSIRLELNLLFEGSLPTQLGRLSNLGKAIRAAYIVLQLTNLLLILSFGSAVIKESMILAETRGIHGTIPTELGHCTSLGTGLKIFFMTILDLSKYFLGIVWKFNWLLQTTLESRESYQVSWATWKISVSESTSNFGLNFNDFL